MIVFGKHNTYKVLKLIEDNGQCKFAHLECIDYYDDDDLGDQIMCRKLGQLIWIANYHFRHMPKG